MKHLGVRPGGHFSVEEDSATLQVMCSAWPGTYCAGDRCDYNLAKLKEGAHSMSQVRQVLEIASTSGQDLSHANASRESLCNKMSGLFFELKEQKDLYHQACPWCDMRRLQGNVANMPLEAKNLTAEVRGLKPLRACPYPMVPVRRPRLVWMNWNRGAGPETKRTVPKFWSTAERIGPHRLNLQCYSSRQGSATELFTKTGSFDICAEQGAGRHSFCEDLHRWGLPAALCHGSTESILRRSNKARKVFEDLIQ